jgi:signal transduction histidine kinase
MTTFDPATLDLLPDPTVAVAADGTVVGANRLATRLGGDLHGRPAAEALPLYDETGADWWACTKPLDGDARLLPRVPEADLRLRLDGRERPVTLTAARLPGKHGGVDLLVISLRRGERRARLDAARSELVSAMSHELRSPLTSVRGFTKTLLARWERFTDEQRQQMLRTIEVDAERVTRLLGELLEVSRIDAGRLHLQRQMVDLPALVERVDATSEVPADLPPLYADPGRLEQVLTSLVEEATHRGAERVTVAASHGAGVVEVTVTGEGAEAPHGNVFAKAVRGGRGAGSGLGPYIARGIVEAHGGRIWVGDGAVTFELPLGGLEGL